MKQSYKHLLQKQEKTKLPGMTKAIILAHYLPQFHPIPENDLWWGKGFTEWTNTAKAKPLFRGHNQPNLPSDLGFYDLRVPEAREQQADLASKHGITGFAYWHYWFGNGKRILERPFNEVLSSGKPDFPFCITWANETWTGVWHGLKNKILVEQTYPGDEDHIQHFNHILPAFLDKRYIKIENKPLFIVYLPHLLPDTKRFTKIWNELAIRNGFDGIYFIGIHYIDWDHKRDGFDEKSVHPLPLYISMMEKNKIRRWTNKLKNMLLSRLSHTYSYEQLIKCYDFHSLTSKDFVPSVLPNWDNTPRSGRKGYVVQGSTPELFRKHFGEMMKFVLAQNYNPHNIVLLKSWNEWAEGNYLEPDMRWGTGYLDAIHEVLSSLEIDTFYSQE
jgi:hypothetical protein